MSRGSLGRGPHGAFAVAVLVLVAQAACSVLVSTNGLSGGTPASDASSDPDGARDSDADGAPGPLPSSCRALRAKLPDAGSGAYDLGSDGGAVKADCDMESFGGGWTRVTPAMIVEDKGVQDYSPVSPAKVAVTRGTDLRGGIVFTVAVVEVNCSAGSPGASPGHYFTVGELDGWTQIMATYEFSKATSCWNIFGDLELPSTNVHPFDLTRDLIGPQLNMSRTAGGAVIPFDGRTAQCNTFLDNFWAEAYELDAKSARVALRRVSQDKPAGLAIQTDCGPAVWKVSDIHVR